MKIGKTLLTGTALLVFVLLASCNIDIFVWGTDPDPEPEVEPGLEFTLSWVDDELSNPHLYLTYPAPDDGDTTDDSLSAPTFTEPYLPPTDGGDLGFDPIDQASGIPSESVDDRGAVFYGDLSSGYSVSGEPAVEMTAVNDESEVIFVRAFPFNSSSTYESTTGGGTTLLPAGSYTWVGVMEVYAYSGTGRLSTASGGGVEAVLTVTNDGEPFAEYVLPVNTNLQGAQIVRINCFFQDTGGSLFEVYQLVPDIRVINSTTQIRSVAPGAEVSDSGVVTIRRPVVE